ncbi:hypothetical protein [Streptomyces sp. ISL-100]|nr:hypothetical protein [Streptomyces sp. ISL-100]
MALHTEGYRGRKPHSVRAGTEAYERLELLRVIGLQDLAAGVG